MLYIGSCLFRIEAKAISSNAVSTPSLFLAEVFMCLILGCFSKNSFMLSYSTSLSSSLSTLLPSSMKGNFSGSLGAPWFRNSVIQLSILSNDWLIDGLLSCWWCHKLAHNNLLPDKMPLPDFWISPALQYPRSILTQYIPPNWLLCHPPRLLSPWNRRRLWPCMIAWTSDQHSWVKMGLRAQEWSLSDTDINK